jgi:hypothetical protein
MTLARRAVRLLDEALDWLPWFYVRDGRLRVCPGGYGCMLELHRFWMREDHEERAAAARYREMIGYDLPREERLARLKQAIDRLEGESDGS